MDLMAYVPHLTESPRSERAPVIKHVCNQPPEEDEFMNMKVDDKIWSRLSKWFLKQRILSKKHPLTRWCLKSTTAVNYEISRHLKSYPYMIHPFSQFRIIWEFFMTIFLFVAFIVIPVSITFYYDKHDNWHVINDVMNIIFLCDIIMWFFTGYYDYRTKVIVLDPMIVARYPRITKYLQSYFLTDVLTTLPIGLIDYGISNSKWYCTTLNLMKVLRIRNYIIYFRRLHVVYRGSFQIQKIVETSTVIIICIHWCACLEYYVPLSIHVLGTLRNDSWVRSSYFQKKKTKSQKYLACLNRAVIAFTRSAHYLDVKTPEDIILNLILTLAGFLVVVYLLTQLFQLMTTFYITVKYHLKIMQQLQEYMRYKELPQSLQRRLSTFYHYRNKIGFGRDKRIINEVSPYLREELIMHNFSTLINSVELFKHLPKAVVAQLSGTLRSEIFMAGDEIVRAGTRGDALFFISSGTVAIYSVLNKEICHLEDGSYFGEIALVMDNEHRIATVITVETSEIYVLYREDFRRFVAPYPDLLNRLQNVALEHLNSSILLEGAEKLSQSVKLKHINISSIKSKKL